MERRQNNERYSIYMWSNNALSSIIIKSNCMRPCCSNSKLDCLAKAVCMRSKCYFWKSAGCVAAHERPPMELDLIGDKRRRALLKSITFGRVLIYFGVGCVWAMRIILGEHNNRSSRIKVTWHSYRGRAESGGWINCFALPAPLLTGLRRSKCHNHIATFCISSITINAI